MSKLDDWSVLEGKTLLHIEAPDGVTILSMAKKRRAEAEMISQMPSLLNALFAWRSAEVHEAAIRIGAREGDHSAAKNKVTECEKTLRILADKLHHESIFRPA